MTDGTLRGYSLLGAFVTTAESFDATLKPIFNHACTQCHTPRGSASIDLSRPATWDARRAVVYDRVVVKETMPPAGSAHTLTDAERTVLKVWAIGK